MRVIALTVSICFVLLSFSGCCDKSVEIVRPVVPQVQDANISLKCTGSDLEVAKCAMLNYFEVKRERDGLRAVVEGLR